MKISDVLRSLVDIVDQGSSELPDAPSHEANASDFTAFTGDLKPVELPDVKSASRIDKTEKTASGNDVQPEELFIPPLQMKMELLKKATNVENIYDDGTPEMQECEREERDGPWDGAHHTYEYVGASTGVVEGPSSRDIAVSESEEIARWRSLAAITEESECDDDDEEEDDKDDEKDRTDESYTDIMRGLLDSLLEEKADKDYDGDGEVESEKDEVWGSRFAAAKKAGKMEEAACDDEQAQKRKEWRQGGMWDDVDDESLDAIIGDQRRKGAKPSLQSLTNKFDDDDQLDELSPDTLSSYIKKAEPARAKAWDLASAAAQRSHKGRASDMDQFMRHSEKFGKRDAGIRRASDRLAGPELDEEFMSMSRWNEGADCQIDELSKDTLKSYVKKAAGEIGHHAANVRQKSMGPISLAHGDRHPKTGESPIDWDVRKTMNRKTGHDRAVDRLEEEPLDELSPKTLGSYVKGATRDALGQAHSAGYTLGGKHGSQDKYLDKVQKRGKGIDRATDRLALGYPDKHDDWKQPNYGDELEESGPWFSITNLSPEFLKFAFDPSNDFYGAIEDASGGGHLARDAHATPNDVKILNYYYDKHLDKHGPGAITAATTFVGNKIYKAFKDQFEGNQIEEFVDAGSGCDWQMHEDAELARIKELANPGINPVILDELSSDWPSD